MTACLAFIERYSGMLLVAAVAASAVACREGTTPSQPVQETDVPPAFVQFTLSYTTAVAGFGHVILGVEAADPDGTPVGITCTGAVPASGSGAVRDSAFVAEEQEARQVTETCTASSGGRTVTDSASATVPALGDTLSGTVDASGLVGKVMFGYQGWFACPGDGSAPNRWVHWFRGNVPSASELTVDLWPDVSELDSSEHCVTSMTLPDGSPAVVFSSFNRTTVVRHFRWMAEHGIDGVFLQRFTSALGDPAFFSLRNQVAENVRAGAQAYARVFAIMYDISGQDEATLVSTLKDDWAYLVDTLGVTQSPRYLAHNGRPVLGIWGLGFGDRTGTAQQATELIDYFQNSAPAQYRATLVAGGPTYWRSLTNDSKADPAWAAVYRSFDVISPWSVGRYADTTGADSFRDNLIVPDMAEAVASGVEYMPVVFPGFSWLNLNQGPLNEIPRVGGRFFWVQVYNALSAGAAMLYVAMFDEVDEGTAMFKLAPTPAELPVQGSFVPLDIDGFALPSDWYLRLGGAAGKMLRGEIPLSRDTPIVP